MNGLCWRVGDGKKILAKSDPWIPGLHTFRSGWNYIPNTGFKVENLILNSGQWNEDYIRQAFLLHEAEAILNIPLNMRGNDDIRFWTAGKNGKYSVKNGYLLESNSLAPNPFHYGISDHAWLNSVWNLRLLPKVRIFFWRALKDIIPTLVNMLTHHVPTCNSEHYARY